MKRFVFILCAIFMSAFAFAQTIRWHVGDSIIRTDTCSSGDSVTPPTVPAKTGYHFTRWDGYTPIEYLESTGTQWIDTGVQPDDTIGVDIDVVWLPKSGGDPERQIMGTRYNNDVRFFVPLPYQGLFGYGWGEEWVQTNLAVNIGALYNIKFNYKNNRQAEINNNVIGNLNSHLPKNTSGVTLPMFAGFYLQYKFLLTGRIYKIKITKDSDIVRDFIPVLDSNGVPCMYDKVTKQFFYNAGTGDFFAGPAVGE